MKIIHTLLLATAVVTTGCSAHLTDLSMISNKTINLDEIDIDKAPQRKLVEGEDTKFNFLFIPFGRPQVKEALNEALRKGEGDLMIDASLYYKYWWFIVGQESLILKGTVVNTKSEKEPN